MQRVAELVLRHERAAGRAAEDEDVEPADVVGDEQAVPAEPAALAPSTRAPTIHAARGEERGAARASGRKQLA